MVSDEKLKELKIAYADMILNTAKEAAARIMVSERRALRLELELKQSKENAIQMLMRLKQMMDSKISEAEIASRAQQKKIEELEAQLQEAEDIVKDLREELSAVQAELEKVTPKDQQVKPMLQVSKALEKNVFNNPVGIVYPPLEEQPDIVPPFDIGNSLLPFWKSCINSQELPSILLRNKSGCTQRIHACERTPLDRELSLSEQTNRIMPDLITKLDERKKIRTRGGQNTKKITSSPNQQLNQVKKMDHVSDNSYLTTSRLVKRSQGEVSDGSIKIDIGLVRVSDAVRRIREELQPVGNDKTEMPLSSEAQVDPLESNALETGGVLIQPASRVIKHTFQRKRKRGTLSTNGSDLHNLKKEENENARSETEKTILMEEPTQEDTEKAILIEESTEVGAEKVILMEKSTQKETEKVILIEESTEVGAEKVILMEKSTQKETEKVNLIEESTQEEERLEQVAQQLISLSEKVVAMKKQMQIQT